MLVKDCMTRHPVVVSPDLSAAEAERIMVENHIRHLPVVEDGKRLIGLITRERLRLKAEDIGSYDVWEITRNLARLKVRSVMIPLKQVWTVAPNRSIERTASLMTEHKIGCLPVVEEGNVVVGIVTQVDLLESFQIMLGLPAKGVRVTVRMSDQPGEFAKLMRVMAEQKWGVMGIGSFPDRRHEGFYFAVLKLVGADEAAVATVLNDIPGQEVVDIRTVV
ncbi:MAG: CBS domain-containing protein [Caldilineaceae bacterium]|nr:CBS domain-containing protein [Caldilineaceae bacterium]